MALTNSASSKTYAAASTGVAPFLFGAVASESTVDLNSIEKTRGLVVFQNDILATGDLVECMANEVGEETYITAGGVYSVGQVVKASTGGKAIAIAATGDLAQGILREASTADGDIVRMEFLGGVYWST